MSRPGDKITLKTMAATAKMRDQIREIELKERSSKSLLANVLGKEEITFIKTFLSLELKLKRISISSLGKFVENVYIFSLRKALISLVFYSFHAYTSTYKYISMYIFSKYIIIILL